MIRDYLRLSLEGLPEPERIAITPADLVPLLGTTTPVVLDIGANDAYTTVSFMREFPDGVFHCFEPDPRAVARAEPNLQGRAHLHPIAIGAEDGMSTFFQSAGAPVGREDEFPEGWNASGSIRRPKTHLEVWPWVTFEHTLEVTTRSLDSWAAEYGIGDVDLIWMDVQGAEDLVFAGGSQVLRRTRFVYTEYSDSEWYEGQRGLLDLLSSLPDWEVLRLWRHDVLLRNFRWTPTGVQ